MKKRVVILGGGVAGMSAAHELVERDFNVVVYEANQIPGGKARSMPVPNSGINGKKDLPGEHGFRFFPGFYHHLPDTMKRIPYKNQPQGVFDNLVNTTQTLGISTNKGQWVAPNIFPTSLDDFSTALEFLSQMLVGRGLNIPRQESWRLLEKLLVFLTSCEDRRFEEYEYIPWWDFVEAKSCSPEFQQYIVSGLTKSLVACRAEDISTRTGGSTFAQLCLDIFRDCSDRVLNAPTNEAWLTPWYDYLTQSGVDFHLSTKVESITCHDQRITGVTIFENGSRQEIEADYYIAAVPVEVMISLVTEPMLKAEPRLGLLPKLRTEWMSGIQFYLDRQITMNHGHTIYLDSPWALTSVSQTQFWSDFNLNEYGNGNVKSIISICISDWNSPGVLYEKPATQCTPEEIKDEVWEQLVSHFSGEDRNDIDSAKVINCFFDPAIVYPNPSEVTNLEPLLINTAGSWDHRPEAITSIENLFLASDYVRCYADLATMEAANETARRAVNGIIEASDSFATPCAVWPYGEPDFLAPFKAYDRLRFRAGLPHQMPPLVTLGSKAIELLNRGMKKLPIWSEALVDELQERNMDQQLVELEWKLNSLWSTVRYAWATSNFKVKQPATDSTSAQKGSASHVGSHFSTSSTNGSKMKEFSSLKILERVSANHDLKGLALEMRTLRVLLEDGMSVFEQNFQTYQSASDPELVQQVVKQILSLPGKRIRPLCVYLAACVGRRSYPEAAENIALAVELVHAASLLHDDVIDVAPQRRHQPSSNLVFGNAASILGGNYLVIQAAQLLFDTGRPDLANDLLTIVEEMILSESEQLENRGQIILDPDKHLKVIKGKTAILFSWGCRAGASISNHPPSVVEALARYGENLGMAFQIIDDLLDLTSPGNLLGKDTFRDLSEGVMTLPFIFAAQENSMVCSELNMVLSNPEQLQVPEVQLKIKELIQQTNATTVTYSLANTYTEKAQAELEKIPFGSARDTLHALAEVSLERLS